MVCCILPPVCAPLSEIPVFQAPLKSPLAPRSKHEQLIHSDVPSEWMLSQNRQRCLEKLFAADVFFHVNH